MLPRRVLPARPLLAVPPSPPRTTSPPHPSTTPPPPRTPPRRSLLYRSVVFLPLLLIYALLGFAGYAVLISLCLQYLLLFRQQVVKPLLIALVFTCLWAGAGGSVGMAWWRGGGAVPIGRDEEEGPLGASGRDGGKDGVEGEEEAEGLLAGEGGEGRAGGRERRGGRQGRLQVKHDGTERFCRKCNVPKPDRAHHCSSCRRCVLKMDHHCPWLGGGCVGWANYKFFLLFLLYTGALGIFTGAVLFHELVNFVDDVENGFELAPISWALAALLGVIFGVAVGMFGLYHLYLACKNRSTIEAMESPSPLRLAPLSSSSPSHPSHPSHPPPSSLFSSSPAARSLPRPRPHTELSYKHRRKLASAARQLNIYDLGWRENLRMVFGEDRQRGRGKKGREERWWMWIMPWGWPHGDGHAFPIDTVKLEKLRKVTEEIYAEAAGLGGSSSSSASEGYEQGRREGGFEIGDEEESGSEESDEDGPVRRA